MIAHETLRIGDVRSHPIQLLREYLSIESGMTKHNKPAGRATILRAASRFLSLLTQKRRPEGNAARQLGP